MNMTTHAISAQKPNPHAHMTNAQIAAKNTLLTANFET
jgi:hypothetical protein